MKNSYKELNEGIKKAKESGKFLISINYLDTEDSDKEYHQNFVQEFPVGDFKKCVNTFSDFCQNELTKMWDSYEGDDKPLTQPKVGHTSKKTN